jgi:hypothetical protein
MRSTHGMGLTAALGAHLTELVLCHALESNPLLHRHRRGFAFPATRSAIAIACLRGFPAASSVRIFRLIVFWLLPGLSGMSSSR